MSVFKKLIILFIFIFINIFCASKGRPGGGPVDRTPPEVISTFPKADSVGIEYIGEIVINFSERMSESSVENAIFIS